MDFSCKLECKGHVVFEAFRPALVFQFLGFLTSHKHFYSDIDINPSNISVDILDCQNDKLEENEIYLQLLAVTLFAVTDV